MREQTLILVLVATLGFVGLVKAAEPKSPELCRHKLNCAPSLWEEQTFELKSEPEGAPLVIRISFPSEPAPSSGYPVVYLLDASRSFHTAAEVAHFQMLYFAPVVVVGIEYPDPFDVARRGADLTPPGADPFLKFLIEDLRSEVAKRVKMDSSRQALFGHSLSAWFALRVALTQPHTFDTYVVGDPSIQIGGYRVVKDLPKLSDRDFPQPARRILITRGTSKSDPEQDRLIKKLNIPLPQPPAPDEYRVTLPEFVQMLQSVKGIDVTYVEFADETHNSMVPAHIGRGMRWTLLGWDPP